MAFEDIIWGANRHVFGGIEPSNMIGFTVEPSDSGMLIRAIPPKNTVINDQTICTVEGVVIRRSDKYYPADEFDGDEVATIRGTEQFIYGDANASPTGTYYYAAFPYSTQKVYNRNPINRITVNKPDKLNTFMGRSGYDDSIGMFYITFEYSLPDTIAGAKIVGSTSDYPKKPSEGVEIADVTESGSCTQYEFDREDLKEGSTIFCSAFTYNSDGRYNYDDFNKITVTIVPYTYYYGYDIELSNSDPDKRVTYPDYTNLGGINGIVVHNVEYDPAGMDANGVFTYGSWLTAGFMPRPCMLNYDGTVAYYLDPDDYTKNINGAASDISNLNFGGNAMMEWPKIWTKRWEEDGVYHFRCCDKQIDESYECWCNYDRNGNQIDHFYTSIYRGMTASEHTFTGALRSISGTTYCLSGAYMTIPNLITKAEENGDDWTVEVLADRLLINDLLVLMGKTTNLEKAFGNGSSMSWTGTTCGDTNAQGLFNGVAKKSSHQSSLKIFGMEDWWGHGGRFVAGWVEDEYDLSIKLTRGTVDGSTATDYNTTGDGYIKIPDILSSTGTDYYITECMTKPYGRFPVNGAPSAGSATTYECDIVTRSNASTATKRALIISGTGKTSVSSDTSPLNTNDGPFRLKIYNDITDGSHTIATGLSCKPSKK